MQYVENFTLYFIKSNITRGLIEDIVDGKTFR
jgi:hypothetical protein